MSAASADRNLLFGILAVQLDFVTKDALIAGMNAWLLNKDKPLGEILRDQGQLSAEELEHLAALVEVHLKRHGNDPQRSLAALSSVPYALRQRLAALPDEAVQQSIAQVASEKPPPPEPDPNRTMPLPSQPPVRYRILRPHAKGGLGEVFVAEDAELGRNVALKEIQGRFADDAVSRERFVREAEITGGLEHPGIVPVYGLGTYADGRPFYAMRFIKGDNLREAIRRFHGEPGALATGELRGLTPPARQFDSIEFRQLLQRFIDVCNAVAYAHSRGVLHRDLKPGNIMLGKYGETLVVDWGLAKPLGRSEHSGTDLDADATLMPRFGGELSATVAGQALGTPAYMSPEQAAGKLDELGPPTDIYSLGATMYELLTGRVPFPEFDLDAVKKGRFQPPRALNPAVPRSLEAVCLKAISLKPADRFGSALDIAKELERWLADEPVTAWREPAGVRVRRWVRKHARLVTGLVAALTVGAVTFGVAAALLTAANQREREAAGREREAKETAQAREAETNAVLDFVDKRVFVAGRPKDQEGGLGYDVSLAAALKAALPFVDTSFPDQPLIEGRLRSMLGTSFFYLGEAKTAANEFQAARVLFTKHRGPDHPDTLASMNDLANTYAALHRPPDALKLREETLPLRQARLGPDHPDTLQSMHNLAISYAALGRHANALKLYEDVLALRKAKLGPGHPHTLWTMHNLANTYAALDRLPDALKLREETLALRKAMLGPDHPDTLLSMGNLAASLVALDRGAEAVTVIDDCLKRAAGKVVDPELILLVMDMRLRHFKKAKDGAGCRATAEMWEKLNRTDARSLYNAACHRAVTYDVVGQTPGTDAARLAPDDADRAMLLLRNALTAGYADILHLLADADLAPLRKRADYAHLLWDLADTPAPMKP